MSFVGSKFRAVIPLSDLPTNGFAASRLPLQSGGRAASISAVNTQISDCAPDASSFAANVPEPGAWTMMIVGFGLLGAMGRRRNRAATA